MPTLICRNPEEEKAALYQLRKVFYAAPVKAGKLVGFNVLGFDGPVLEQRARYLGAKGLGLDLQPYRSRNVLDVQSVLTFNGSDGQHVMSRSQAAFCRRFGIDIPDDHNGSYVHTLIQAGDYEAVAAHCESDVRRTVELYRRLGFTMPALVVDIETDTIADLDAYREFVKAKANLKDPVKIEEDIREKLDKASLDPNLARIVVIGYAVEEGVPF